jgi:GNAT superfamily N-acetyltransferase
VRVRRAEPEEYAAVGRLLVAAYAPSGMPPDAPYWGALRDTAARAADAEVWVADGTGTGSDRHAVAGTVTWAGRGSGQREIAREDEAEFRMLAVDPALQGQGVGQVLLQAVVDRARRDRYVAVVLCSATWMTAAHRLYARAGFHRIPERDWTPAPGVDLLAFRCSLEAPPCPVPDRLTPV